MNLGKFVPKLFGTRLKHTDLERRSLLMIQWHFHNHPKWETFIHVWTTWWLSTFLPTSSQGYFNQIFILQSFLTVLFVYSYFVSVFCEVVFVALSISNHWWLSLQMTVTVGNLLGATMTRILRSSDGAICSQVQGAPCLQIGHHTDKYPHYAKICITSHR